MRNTLIFPIFLTFSSTNKQARIKCVRYYCRVQLTSLPFWMLTCYEAMPLLPHFHVLFVFHHTREKVNYRNHIPVSISKSCSLGFILHILPKHIRIHLYLVVLEPCNDFASSGLMRHGKNWVKAHRRYHGQGGQEVVCPGFDETKEYW